MNLYDAIQDRVPQKWRASGLNQSKVPIQKYTEEYNSLEQELRAANVHKTIATITRVQNVFDYGQFLIREQLLMVSSAGQQVYSVRRFIKVKKTYKEMALKYNCDPRRCSLGTLTFVKTLPSLFHDDMIFIVRVLTKTPQQQDIQPKNSLEYYVEYFVELM